MDYESFHVGINSRIDMGIIFHKVDIDRIKIVQILEVLYQGLVIGAITLDNIYAVEIGNRIIVYLDIIYLFDFALA